MTQRMPCTTAPTTTDPVRAGRRPSADVHETEAAWTLTLALPGVAEGDVEVSLEADTLCVKAGRKAHAAEGYQRRQGDLGEAELQRSFFVPEGLDAEAVTAQLRAGLLTVTLPKAGPRRRSVEVQVG